MARNMAKLPSGIEGRQEDLSDIDSIAPILSGFDTNFKPTCSQGANRHSPEHFVGAASSPVKLARTSPLCCSQLRRECAKVSITARVPAPGSLRHR